MGINCFRRGFQFFRVIRPATCNVKCKMNSNRCGRDEMWNVNSQILVAIKTYLSEHHLIFPTAFLLQSLFQFRCCFFSLLHVQPLVLGDFTAKLKQLFSMRSTFFVYLSFGLVFLSAAFCLCVRSWISYKVCVCIRLRKVFRVKEQYLARFSQQPAPSSWFFVGHHLKYYLFPL